MPNWPMNSSRAVASPASSRFELLPIVARNWCTSGPVRPTPVSVTVSRSPAWTVMAAGAAGSSASLAVIASAAFCSSSRR